MILIRASSSFKSRACSSPAFSLIGFLIATILGTLIRLPRYFSSPLIRALFLVRQSDSQPLFWDCYSSWSPVVEPGKYLQRYYIPQGWDSYRFWAAYPRGNEKLILYLCSRIDWHWLVFRLFVVRASVQIVRPRVIVLRILYKSQYLSFRQNIESKIVKKNFLYQ